MVESSYYYVGKAVYLSYDPKIWMHNILIKYTLQYVPESKPLKRWISRERSFPPSLKTQMGIYSYKKIMCASYSSSCGDRGRGMAQDCWQTVLLQFQGKTLSQENTAEDIIFL